MSNSELIEGVPAKELAGAIRALAMDAVEQAKSGHPGMPMGMADAATVLFSKFLKFDASAPNWPDRDRFVLSAGHGSMLLYALLLSHRLRRHDAWMRSSVSVSLVRRRRATRKISSRRALRRPPARSGRASQMAVGMAMAEAHLAMRASATISSITVHG